ncbi:alpha-N-arabinofuranosidase [Brevundimonas sp. FT23028]|uniref:alpha-N-arabinofuranosidase n=1 Tax=Brevundimonas sp. FT23028 TaxID=3393748 RepID=UPI003B588D72
MRVRSLAALVVAVSLVGTTAAADVRGVVRLDQPGATVNPDVYGQFMEQLGSGITGGVWVGESSEIANTRGFRNDVIDALKALEVPVVRWPGGCYADIYHWRNGIGARSARPVTLNRWWGGSPEDNAFGTHEFFDFAELIGAKTYLSLNMGSGTPAEAADWVEYITSDGDSTLAQERRANGRSRPWKIDYLGLGNEPWGCGGRMRASYYTDLMRQYAGFVAAPGTVTVAAGPNAEDYEWTRTLMRDGRDSFDQLSLHYYTLPTGDWARKGAAVGFNTTEWRSTFDQAYRIEEMIRAHDAIMDEYDPEGRIGLAIDEWGAWYDPTPGTTAGHLQQQNSLRDALLAAVHFNIFHRHADRVRMTNVAQMVNVLQALILTDGPRMTLTPTYHAFMLYKPFRNATVVPVELEGTGGARLDVAAARGGDGQLYIAVVNLNPDHPEGLALELDGGALSRVTGQVLTASRTDAHNAPEYPEAVTPNAFNGGRLAGRTLTAQVPAKALVVLTVR